MVDDSVMVCVCLLYQHSGAQRKQNKYEFIWFLVYLQESYAGDNNKTLQELTVLAFDDSDHAAKRFHVPQLEKLLREVINRNFTDCSEHV